MTLAQFTELKLLLPRLRSQHRDGAIVELSQCLEDAGCIENATRFIQAVFEHESLVSAVFDGVALPLARGQAVKELAFAVGLSPQGIRWGAAQVLPVHTVILFAVPFAEGETHLSLALTFSHFLKDEMALAALRRCVQPEEMLEVLSHVQVFRRGIHAPRGGPLAEY